MRACYSLSNMDIFANLVEEWLGGCLLVNVLLFMIIAVWCGLFDDGSSWLFEEFFRFILLVFFVLFEVLAVFFRPPIWELQPAPLPPPFYYLLTVWWWCCGLSRSSFEESHPLSTWINSASALLFLLCSICYCDYICWFFLPSIFLPTSVLKLFT